MQITRRSVLSGLPTVHMLGLTDPHVARFEFDRSYNYPGHQRHDGAYVLDRRPGLIILANGPISYRQGNPFPWWVIRPYESDVLADERFELDYLLMHLRLGTGEPSPRSSSAGIWRSGDEVPPPGRCAPRATSCRECGARTMRTATSSWRPRSDDPRSDNSEGDSRP